MPRLLSSVFTLRRDPRILKLPPYLSLLCIVIGVAWLFLLPLDDYSRRTYISENALLPGQVHTYFSGSDQHVFRAYRHEVTEVGEADNYAVNDKLETILGAIGLKVGRQNYTYQSAGDVFTGQNIYAILQAPRGDATEAIVLVAAWRTIADEFNRNGVSLALTLARYFRRWSLWSKDIIILIPPDSRTGTQAWVDAYHNAHDPTRIGSLPIKSGLLQGVVALDYPQERRFESVHIVYDGVNGQLPNLDLINSIANIAGGQMGMGASIRRMYKHTGKYGDNLQTMLRGMLNQGLGHATGPHSSFIPYHVDAVTIQAHGEGWHDEMAMGRLIEGSFRSLNNLLEHLHQSFFFYLLMRKDRFVSIGTYLPSAMLLAASFTIMAIYLWVKSGHASKSGATTPPPPNTGKEDTSDGEQSGIVPPHTTIERDLLLPLGVVAVCQAFGVVPLYIFSHMPESMLSSAFAAFAAFSALAPHIASYILTTYLKPTFQQYQLIKCFSLLLVGMFLSSLATLNFSLAFLVGFLSAPMSFTPSSTTRSPATQWASMGLLNTIAPTAVVYAACSYGGLDVTHILREAAFGWNVWGLYTPVIIWCVWWPAWLVAGINVLGEPSMAKDDTPGT